LKTWVLNKRIEDLSEKLVDEPGERVARIDISSFTEPEKLLVQKIWDLQEEYGVELPPEVIEANKDLILKAHSILINYVLDTFRYATLSILGNYENEIDKWYFNLHFYNFFLDLKECLDRVHKWPKKECEWFLNFLKEDGMKSKVFRFPRGTKETTSKLEKEEEATSDVSENEHYDRV
jgi:hypothetical protein